MNIALFVGSQSNEGWLIEYSGGVDKVASHAKQIIDLPRDKRKEFFDNKVPDDLKPMVKRQCEKYFRELKKIEK